MSGNTSFLATEQVDRTLSSFVRIANTKQGLEKIGFSADPEHNNGMPKFCCFISVYEDVFCFHSSTASLMAEIIVALTNRRGSFMTLKSEIERIAGPDDSAVFVIHNAWGASLKDCFWRVSSVRYDATTSRFVDSERMINPLNLFPLTSSRSVVRKDAPETMVDSEMAEFRSKFHGCCIDLSTRMQASDKQEVDEEVSAAKQLATYRPLLAKLRSDLAQSKAELENEREKRKELIEKEKTTIIAHHNTVVEQLVSDCQQADRMRDEALAARKSCEIEIQRLTDQVVCKDTTAALSERVSDLSGKLLMMEEELAVSKQKAIVAHKAVESAKKSLRESESRREADAIESEQSKSNAKEWQLKLSEVKTKASETLADLIDARQRSDRNNATFRKLLVCGCVASRNQAAKAVAFRLLFVSAYKSRVSALRKRIVQQSKRVDVTLESRLAIMEGTNLKLTKEREYFDAREEALRAQIKDAHDKLQAMEAAEREKEREKERETEREKERERSERVSQETDTGGTVELKKAPEQTNPPEQAKQIEQTDHTEDQVLRADNADEPERPQEGAGGQPDKISQTYSYPAQAVAQARACIAHLTRFVDTAVSNPASNPVSSQGTVAMVQQTPHPPHYGHVTHAYPPYNPHMYPPAHAAGYYTGAHQMVYYPQNEGW